MGNDHIRPDVTFISGGYPTPDNPRRQIFTHRSVKELSKYIKPLVIHLRYWRPIYPLVEIRTWDGIDVISFSIPQLPHPKALSLNLFIREKLGIGLLRKYVQNPNLLHSVMVFPTGYIVSHWARALNAAHVTQAIGSDVHIHLLKRNVSTVSNQWLEYIHGVACNSQAISKDLASLLPQLKNLRVIYRGVDTDEFSPNGACLGPLRNKPWGRFLYLGGFQENGSNLAREHNFKGGHILLDAWKKASERLNKSSLLISGPGVNSNYLDDWMSSLHHPTNVFVHPEIHPSEVSGFIRSSDVVVIPSLDEGLPNLANEAQACGRPVLGTDAGGIPETVLHRITGLIVPRGNSDALADGLVWFVENPDELVKLAGNARKHMVNDFRWETFRENMLNLYDAAITIHRTQ